MRTDLPSMNAGRAMAQAAHAANQFIHEWGKNEKVRQWQKDANGFGTTICLAATKDEIKEVLAAKHPEHIGGLVYDPTYSFTVPVEISRLINSSALTAPTLLKEDGNYLMFRNELTCAYLFISTDDPDKEMLIGDLLLHP